MKQTMKTFFKIVGSLIALVILLVGSFVYSIFGGQQRPRTGPALPHGIEQVADGIATIYILNAGTDPETRTQRVVLIDAGNDTSGAPTLSALEKRGLTAANVAAIFITHAHPDHDASVNTFPKAQVYAMQDEVEVAAGRERYLSPLSKVFGATNPHPFTVTKPLHDGDTVKVGDLTISAFEVSGHTPGSAVYLAQGTLFTGDAFNFKSDLSVEGPVSWFSTNEAQAILSLKTLVQKLSQRTDIEMIATSHTGNEPGADGIRALQLYLSRH